MEGSFRGAGRKDPMSGWNGRHRKIDRDSVRERRRRAATVDGQAPSEECSKFWRRSKIEELRCPVKAYVSASAGASKLPGIDISKRKATNSSRRSASRMEPRPCSQYQKTILVLPCCRARRRHAQAQSRRRLPHHGRQASPANSLR